MSDRPEISPLDYTTDCAKKHADHRDQLRDEITALDDDIKAAQRKHIKRIRELARRAKESGDKLLTAIEAAPSLFKKPRSMVLNGLRFGYAKSKPKLSIADEARTIKQIRKHCDKAEQAGLIVCTEKVDKKQAAKLNNHDRRMIGVVAIPGVDGTFIKPIDSDIDQLVEKILTETKTLETE